MTQRLILARHASVDSRYAGRFLGSSDVPLSARGRRQASALARVLESRPIDRFLVSPLERASQTAAAMERQALVDPDLREIDFGRWEGRSFDEISQGEPPELIDRWGRFDLEFCFPQGESLGAFVGRIDKLAVRLTAQADETLGVITHGGVIRSMICRLLGLAPSHYLLFDVPPASITTIDLFDGRGVLSGLSDVCHLEGLD